MWCFINFRLAKEEYRTTKRKRKRKNGNAILLQQTAYYIFSLGNNRNLKWSNVRKGSR